MAKLGEPFEIDPPEPDWLEPPRQCGHEWRNNDFTCMDCVEGRITVREHELSLARSALVRIAELDGDCENQKFNLTRFQAAQVARRFLASSATGRVASDPETAESRALPIACVVTSDGICRPNEQGYCNFCGQKL